MPDCADRQILFVSADLLTPAFFLTDGSEGSRERKNESFVPFASCCLNSFPCLPGLLLSLFIGCWMFGVGCRMFRPSCHPRNAPSPPTASGTRSIPCSLARRCVSACCWCASPLRARCTSAASSGICCWRGFPCCWRCSSGECPAAGAGRGFGSRWSFFYPNAFYITTDFIHLKNSGGVFRWFDLLTVMSFAVGGMFLGCLSLYLLHLFVRERFGWCVGWLFAGGTLAMGSFGIYLGRVLRVE